MSTSFAASAGAGAPCSRSRPGQAPSAGGATAGCGARRATFSASAAMPSACRRSRLRALMPDAGALFAQAAARLHAGDLSAARELFGRAGAAGRRDAAAIHCNLVAQDDWQRGLALLRALAPVDRLCRRQLEMV